jgi:hypothetical protein
MSSRVKMPPDTQVYIHVFVLICVVVLRRTRTRTATYYLNQHSSAGHPLAISNQRQLVTKPV